MRKSKNIFTVVLMGSSLVLLVTLQFFWLRSSYEKAFFDFRRESSVLLRTTVFSLRDSLFVKNIMPMAGDNIHYKQDSIKVKMLGTTAIFADSLKIREHSSKVQVFISSTASSDSAINILKPLASSIHRMEGQKSFMIRLGPDMLDLDTLSQYYSKVLGQSNIHVPFQIKHIQMSGPMFKTMSDESGDMEWIEREGPYKDTLITDHVRLNPGHSYAAVFPGIRVDVLKEITPQILFSGFLTFIIATSFVIMYRSLKTQQRLNDLKNDFISNVTHELKTPVATVSVALEAMKDFNALNNSERTKEYLIIAQNELNRLTLMTDKILKASVFENHGVSFIPEKVDLDAIIQQVLSSMRLIFEKRKLSVEYTPEGTNFELKGSEVHLTNVIYNLADNALKYSAENSLIEIHLKNLGDNFELLIQDQGIGIAKEYQKKIFDKFFRVPTGDVHNVKGYGLGLNYVAGVVKTHGGKIEVESEGGKGSLFRILLPKK